MVPRQMITNPPMEFGGICLAIEFGGLCRAAEFGELCLVADFPKAPDF